MGAIVPVMRRTVENGNIWNGIVNTMRKKLHGKPKISKPLSLYWS